MKKQYRLAALPLLCVLGVGLVTTPAWSDNDVSEARRLAAEARKAELEARVEEKQQEHEAELEARRAEREAAVEARRAEFEEKVETRRAEAEARAIDRCDKIEQNIEVRINRYESVRLQHLNIYETMAERIDQLLDRLEENAIDTSDARTKLNDFQVKVTELQSATSSTYEVLVESRTTACGESEVSFKSTLESARQGYQSVRSNVQEVRTMFTEQLRPALEALKQQTT